MNNHDKIVALLSKHPDCTVGPAVDHDKSIIAILEPEAGLRATVKVHPSGEVLTQIQVSGRDTALGAFKASLLQLEDEILILLSDAVD